jgi:single-strand DNA-binding protein
MANLNKVMLIGRLTRDPEVVPFSNGGKVAKFGFAVNNRKLNQTTGQWEDVPVFLDIEVYNRGENGKMADRVADTLRKGQQIFIEGHLKLDSWEKDGQKRSRLVIVVDNFQYLERREDGGGGGMGGGRPAMATQRRAPASGGYAPANGNYGDDAGDLEPPPSRGGNGPEDDIPF